MLERLRGFFRRRGRARENVVIAPLGGSSAEYPSISFADYIEAYLKDPDIAASVDFLTNQVVAPGFHTESDNEEAKKLIDDFCAKVNLDNLLFSVVKEVVLTGNSFLRYQFDSRGRVEGLIHLKISGIKRVLKGKESNKPVAYIYAPDGIEQEIPAEEIIHFAWNPVDGSVFGVLSILFLRFLPS